MDLFCPQTHTVPLSSELTILSPSGLRNFIDNWTVSEKKIGVQKSSQKYTHLNKQQRIASPFSCDKIFVFVPSVKSHSIIVPSTDAEHNTPPYVNSTYNRKINWHRKKTTHSFKRRIWNYAHV